MLEDDVLFHKAAYYPHVEVPSDSIMPEDPEDENVDDNDSMEHYEGHVEGDTITFKTQKVADILGISDQDVRNYTQAFEEFLNIRRTRKGHREYTRENIDKLNEILTIKKNNGYTVEQTRAVLKTEPGQIMSAATEMEKLERLLNVTTQRQEDALKRVALELISEIKNSNTNMLESRDNDVNEIVGKLQVAHAEETDKIMALMEQVLKENKDKQSQIELLTEQNERILQAVQKKRRGLFGKKQ